MKSLANGFVENYCDVFQLLFVGWLCVMFIFVFIFTFTMVFLKYIDKITHVNK